MRAAILLTFWPVIALGQDAARYTWGIPVEGARPSLLSLEPCELPCVAVVRFDNTLVTTGQIARSGTPGAVRATLAGAGLSVEVTVETGIGMMPDVLQVWVPPGYITQPSEVPVEDNATGRVRVLLAPTS